MKCSSCISFAISFIGSDINALPMSQIIVKGIQKCLRNVELKFLAIVCFKFCQGKVKWVF